jgi:hypothetical protein
MIQPHCGVVPRKYGLSRATDDRGPKRPFAVSGRLLYDIGEN